MVVKTMKFIVNSAKDGGARRGTISELPRISNFKLDTPALMIFTKGHAVPHLTQEVSAALMGDTQIVESPLQTTIQMESPIAKQGSGIAKFCSMEGNVTYLCYNDPLIENPQGHFERDEVPLWSRIGKRMFNATRYMDLVESYKPDLYHALCDGSVDKDSSKKRLSKSASRTVSLFNACLERHSKSEYLSRNTSIMAVIIGACNKEDRQHSLNKILPSADKVGGFVLEGLTLGGPNTESKTFTDIQEILEDVTPQLPKDKLRIIQGCWNPVVVLEAVSRGWDLFDSTYPTNITESGRALTFSFDTNETDFAIDLNDISFKEDFTPLLKNCTCLSCTKHTRAYVNHLLNTREMLAQVLLMIHNLHHYMSFFAEIRRRIEENTLKSFTAIVSEQYEKHQMKIATTPIIKRAPSPVRKKRQLSE